MAPETKKIAGGAGQQIVKDGLVKDSPKHLKTVAVRAYSNQKKQPIENEQITELLPMVQKIVRRVITYLKPPLSFEDLVSAGTVGLVKAARDYEPSHRAEFKTYAYIRIRGAVLDELRSISLLPANLSRQVHNALKLSQEIIGQTGTAPSDAELADKLGITIDKLYETFENARALHFISIDGCGDNDTPLGNLLAAADAARPDEQLEQTELIDKLAEAIKQLPERQRQIILLYYQQHLTMKQIAKVFEITEPRISQLHANALFNLSVKLRQWDDSR
ncbi:MAG TPA: FliA/WhiG family RNA polymerase sigma factor [Phycisphaerales bacterium]|nr:FliA/WhiG family RNA polymerase sigma factor [Phycisphaerales bacterium]